MTSFYFDVANLYHCLKPVGKLNYKAALKMLEKRYGKGSKYAYGSKTEECDKFEIFLRNLGFTTLFKRVVNGKANCDVEIAVDISKDKSDTIVLGSADGDFEYALQQAKDRGAKIVVIGKHISVRLKILADETIEIGEDLLYGQSTV